MVQNGARDMIYFVISRQLKQSYIDKRSNECLKGNTYEITKETKRKKKKNRR